MYWKCVDLKCIQSENELEYKDLNSCFIKCEEKDPQLKISYIRHLIFSYEDVNELIGSLITYLIETEPQDVKEWSEYALFAIMGSLDMNDEKLLTKAVKDNLYPLLMANILLSTAYLLYFNDNLKKWQPFSAFKNDTFNKMFKVYGAMFISFKSLDFYILSRLNEWQFLFRAYLDLLIEHYQNYNLDMLTPLYEMLKTWPKFIKREYSVVDNFDPERKKHTLEMMAEYGANLQDPHVRHKQTASFKNLQYLKQQIKKITQK